MQPQHPRSLRLFAAITRNPSLDRWRERRAEKRGGGLDVLLHELEDCLPAVESVEDAVESHELARATGRWLDGLATLERVRSCGGIGAVSVWIWWQGRLDALSMP